MQCFLRVGYFFLGASPQLAPRSLNPFAAVLLPPFFQPQRPSPVSYGILTYLIIIIHAVIALWKDYRSYLTRTHCLLGPPQSTLPRMFKFIFYFCIRFFFCPRSFHNVLWQSSVCQRDIIVILFMRTTWQFYAPINLR